MDMDVDADENTGPRTGAAGGRGKAGTAGKKARVGALKSTKKKSAKVIKEKGWCENPNGGPPLTKTAGNFLSAILAVWNCNGRTELETVLAGPEVSSSVAVQDSSSSPPSDDSDDSLPPPPPDYDPTDTKAAYIRVVQLSKKSRLLDLEIMMAHIQLALNVDSYVPPVPSIMQWKTNTALGRFTKPP